MLDQVVEALCGAEVQFVCVERIDEYSKVQSEVNLYQLYQYIGHILTDLQIELPFVIFFQNYRSSFFKIYIINSLFLLQAPWEIPGSDPSDSWPNSGEVQFKNYSTRYRPGLDLVIKNVSFSIHSGEKVKKGYRLGTNTNSTFLSN